MDLQTLLPHHRTYPETLRDRHSRPLRDLRISVIDRCNFRCPYCMPAEHYPEHYTFLKQRDWLNFDEITRLARLFVSVGVLKIRLTGGEPLLRPDIAPLITRITGLDGLEDLALTTNGYFLAEQANSLKKAGLKRLTISLDSVDEKIFQALSGGRRALAKVLRGIEAARMAGFSPIKLNVVVQKGINDHALLNILEHWKGPDYIIRFLEYMDVGNRNHWQPENVVSAQEILRIIRSRYQISELMPNYHGEVARRYRLEDGREIGFVTSVSQPFCGNCNRARLSADGKLYTCLFASQGVDLKAPLRQGKSDEEILDIIRSTWTRREDRYSEVRSEVRIKHHPKKIEMYQIGG